MIKAGDLYRYFIVREIATGRELWLLNGDVRYDVTDPSALLDHYKMTPRGAYFLTAPAGQARPWGRLTRLDEVEPLPDGRGLWHPAAWEHASKLPVTYRGSWREHAARMVAA